MQQTEINQISNKDKQSCFALITEAWVSELAKLLLQGFAKLSNADTWWASVQRDGGGLEGNTEAGDRSRSTPPSPQSLSPIRIIPDGVQGFESNVSSAHH